MTIAHYDRLAEAYWDGTRDHDINQNYAALLDAIEGNPPIGSANGTVDLGWFNWESTNDRVRPITPDIYG